MIEAQIIIRLKKDVLDPEGKAIQMALGNLGFDNLHNIRKGKIIELTLDETDQGQAKKTITQICEKLLCNQVIEDYQFTLSDDADSHGKHQK